MIRLVAVVDGLEGLPPMDGLERRQVEGVEVVVAHEAAPPSAEVSREAVLRHAQVVEELMHRSAAILPAQLGRAFRDDEELADAVRAEAPRLARRLDRVRGCVEFGLRAITAEPEPPGAGTGAEYMRARLEQVQREDRLVERLHEPLARLARATTLHRRSGELSAAYLVARADVPAFEAAASKAERADGATVVCTGPWPPYSFAEGES